jgi:antagonist of KipI
MMTVLKPGPLTTVQDGGRRGYRAFGMPVAGAMDRLSYALANVLAGNPPGAAALEMTLLGATLRLERDGYVAVCGADMRATLDGEPVANGSGFLVRRGAELACRSAAAGCRAYLAVHGGIDVPPVLGSRSTYTRGAIGGFQGRALRAGDALPIGPAGASLPGEARALPAGLLPGCPRELSLRVLLGPQDDHFLPEGVRTFLEAGYPVSNRNDRMGYQLDGPVIAHRDKADIVSDALCPGAIQVPGRGTPIVMMADCQTTGGYAKIATVIGPDLARLAQARFGDTIKFTACSDEEAVAALHQERETVLGAAAAFRTPARRRAARR